MGRPQRQASVYRMPYNARCRCNERKVHIASFLGHGVISIKFQCFWHASGDHLCRVVGGIVFATYRISDTPDHAKTFYVTFLVMSRNRVSRMYTLPFESQRNWAMLSLAKSMAEQPPQFLTLLTMSRKTFLHDQECQESDTNRCKIRRSKNQAPDDSTKMIP